VHNRERLAASTPTGFGQRVNEANDLFAVLIYRGSARHSPECSNRAGPAEARRLPRRAVALRCKGFVG
jgi:hypothetical protein